MQSKSSQIHLTSSSSNLETQANPQPIKKPLPTPPQKGSKLPPGWTEIYDPQSGKNYYYNSVTDVSQWEKPSNIH